MSKELDFSIIIPVWNGENFITKTIEKALNQEGISYEILIVDDCSLDRTKEELKLINHSNVKTIFLEENKGPGGARNAALELAKGKWVALLDSDDAFVEGRLKYLLENAGEADILVDNIYQNHNGIRTVMFSTKELPIGILNLEYLISTNIMGDESTSTGYLKPIFRNSFLKEHSIRYWDDIRVGEDYYFFANCLANGAKAMVVDFVGYEYFFRQGSISRKIGVQHCKDLIRCEKRFARKFKLSETELYEHKKRLKSILTVYYFNIIVESIKEFDVQSFLKAFFKSPRSILLLREAINKRCKKFLWRVD